MAAFLGIPFAASPAGRNRWRAPMPVLPWKGLRPARAFGHNCWQGVTPQGFGPWTHEYVVQNDISEDCLFLNVWTPAKASRPLPILVWIHGGGFNSGSGAIPIYNGRALAARGVIVVTINYRVGVFGFLAHPALTREAHGAPPTNFGLQDIIAALKWVKANAAAFHGDPRRVTIAGQSAGAMAVHDLIASPMARGLFQRAIAESGLPSSAQTPSLAEAEKDGMRFAQDKGAASLVELRALPPEILQSGSGGNAIRFVPTVDGVLLAQSPADALRTGRFARVPVLAGMTADEGSAIGEGYGAPAAAALEALLKQSFGPMADRFRPYYPAATDAERIQSNIQIRRDRGLGALYAWAKSRAGRGAAPAFVYIFTHVEPGPEATHWRAFHSSEIPYVFQTLDAAPEREFATADAALSQAMSAYWLNFARTGNPNGSGLPVWPEISLRDPAILEIGDTIGARPILAGDKLRLIEIVSQTGGRLSIF